MVMLYVFKNYANACYINIASYTLHADESYSCALLPEKKQHSRCHVNCLCYLHCDLVAVIYYTNSICLRVRYGVVKE